jgi:hypothetical protein
MCCYLSEGIVAIVSDFVFLLLQETLHLGLLGRMILTRGAILPSGNIVFRAGASWRVLGCSDIVYSMVAWPSGFLTNRRVMMAMRRVIALVGLVVASTAGLSRLVHLFLS